MIGLVLLAACNGNKIAENKGFKMSEYFPQDGSRAAVYDNEDEGFTSNLRMEKGQEPILVDDVETWQWDVYESTDNDLVLLWSIQWSAPSGDGASILSYTDGAGEKTTFDPPIAVAPITDYMNTGDIIETQTGGTTWTSEILDVGDCEVLWGTLTWSECIHMRIDDGEGNDADDLPFAGEYWQATSYGTAWFQPSGDASKWVLLDYEWEVAQ